MALSKVPKTATRKVPKMATWKVPKTATFDVPRMTAWKVPKMATFDVPDISGLWRLKNGSFYVQKRQLWADVHTSNYDTYITSNTSTVKVSAVGWVDLMALRWHNLDFWLALTDRRWLPLADLWPHKRLTMETSLRLRHTGWAWSSRRAIRRTPRTGDASVDNQALNLLNIVSCCIVDLAVINRLL